ncbi:MAG TPA: glycosyltransferase, partial [Candidatus Paceibacterota bacterium]|nr:glycosyltransferase [Candidatus Paceibacterota bacterium]
LSLCVASAPEEFSDIFIPFPKERRLARIFVLRRLVNRLRPDWIFTVNEGHLWLPILLKLFCGVKIAVELQGLGFEEKYGDGKITYINYLYSKYSVWFFLHFYDLVIAVSHKLVEYYAPMSRKNWVVVSGGVALEALPQAAARPGDGGTFTVGYMGNTRGYQGLPFVLEAVALCKKRGMPVRLNLILSGNIVPTEAKLDELGIRDITILHHNVSHEEASRLIMESDVLPIPRPSIAITEFAFPSKLPEYLGSGIPTIMTEVGPVAELGEELRACSIIIPAHDIAEQLAKGFEKVRAMESGERQAMGQRARAFVAQKFDWHTLGTTMSQAFES